MSSLIRVVGLGRNDPDRLTRPLKCLAYPAYQACPYLPMSTSPSYITATIATTNNVCIPFSLSYLASHTLPFIGVVDLGRNDADCLTRPPIGPGLPSLPILPTSPHSPKAPHIPQLPKPPETAYSYHFPYLT